MDQATLQQINEVDLTPPLRLAPMPPVQVTFVASTFRRGQAFFIDESLRILAFIPWWISGRSWVWLGFCCAFHFSARVMCLRLAGGTPGKLLMGLRLVGRERDQLEWSQAGLRTLTDDLSTVVGFGTRVLAFLRFDRTHLSDWIAETRLVQVKPRANFPHRRWAIALILFVVLSVNGLEQSVHWLQSISNQ